MGYLVGWKWIDSFPKGAVSNLVGFIPKARLHLFEIGNKPWIVQWDRTKLGGNVSQ